MERQAEADEQVTPRQKELEALILRGEPKKVDYPDVEALERAIGEYWHRIQKLSDFDAGIVKEELTYSSGSFAANRDAGKEAIRGMKDRGDGVHSRDSYGNGIL